LDAGENEMLDAKDMVLWTNRQTREVVVGPRDWGVPEDYDGSSSRWSDPIGAAYLQWGKMTDAQRVQLMLETAIDLAMQGFPLAKVLQAFATVKQFRALGSESYPMCRALTSALVGKCLEPNTMTFEELLEHYRPQVAE
jgi:hypothetical protein